MKMITQMEYIHNSLKELLDLLENLKKFINQHFKNPPPIIRSDQIQKDGKIPQKSQFSRRENEEEVLTINVDHKKIYHCFIIYFIIKMSVDKFGCFLNKKEYSRDIIKGVEKFQSILNDYDGYLNVQRKRFKNSLPQT